MFLILFVVDVFIYVFCFVREEWVQAIRYVANKLKENEAEQNAATGDVDMGTMVDDDILSKLTMQGTSTGKTSGKKKVVSVSLVRF